MIQPRELALKILYDIEKHGAYLNISFQNHAEQVVMSPRDMALAKELCYGVLRFKIKLDNTIARFSSVKLKKLSPFVISILRMGLYQLFYMDKIPESAAVNESVKLAERYARQSKGFINAILRRAAGEGLFEPSGNNNEALAIRHSHPEPLVHWLRMQFGDEKAVELLDANNQTPPISIRTNTLKNTRQSLMEQLKAEDVACAPGSWSDAAILIDGASLQQLKAYKEGRFTIQDQSAQLAAFALAPQPGQRVFDVCAAPGGKTTHLAELMENKGEILGLDIYEKRLKAVQESAKRLGISIITTHAEDASKFTVTEKADKILVDAPCSGLGVIRRRPDLKYKEELTEFDGLIKTQAAILEHCALLLKPAGELVYSTCTINPAENEGVVNDFLKKHPEFSLMPIKSEHIKGDAAELLQKGMATFYPSLQGGDGFFIAKLRRAST